MAMTAPPTPTADPTIQAVEAELAQAQKELAWELSKATVDAAGLVDPTPISDGIGAAMSLAEGDLLGAGLSLISMVPYLGDALAKSAKGARALEKLAALRKRIIALTARLASLRKANPRDAAVAARDAVDIGMQHLSENSKAILRCPQKQAMIEQAVKHAGVNRSVAARLLEIADQDQVLIRMRPTNKEARAWINRGHPPKPESLKMKTINEVDELIGAPKNSKGLVGYFRPKMPDAALNRENPELYKKALARYNQRKIEHKQNGGEVGRLTRAGEIRIENGVVIQRHSGKAYAGDNDVFDIRNADGTPVDAKKREAIIAKLKEPPVSAQHGDHMSWDRHGDPKKEQMYHDIINNHTAKVDGGGGEALAEFGRDGYRPTFAQPRTRKGGD